MKLESWDELESDEQFFCWSCGKHLKAMNEISQRICHECKQRMQELKEDQIFFCWACGKQLLQISEVAQGVCHGCKASIIRKIQPPSIKQKINKI
jgi:DNA-directed RNA polymerase subunit RPC12/RpoP